MTPLLLSRPTRTACSPNTLFGITHPEQALLQVALIRTSNGREIAILAEVRKSITELRLHGTNSVEVVRWQGSGAGRPRIASINVDCLASHQHASAPASGVNCFSPAKDELVGNWAEPSVAICERLPLAKPVWAAIASSEHASCPYSRNTIVIISLAHSINRRDWLL